MANLGPDDTGVDGIIYISTAQGQHGPRVKWYPRRAGRTEPCVTVTLAAQPVVIDHGVAPAEFRFAEDKVVAWVKRNRAELLDFWSNGLSWMRQDVSRFIDGLAKLP